MAFVAGAGFVQSHVVDLPVCEFRAAVAGVACGPGGLKDPLAALGRCGQGAVFGPVRVLWVIQRADIGHNLLDFVVRWLRALHAFGERLDHGFVQTGLPAVPCPGAGFGDPAHGWDFLSAALVPGAQVVPAVVHGVKIESVCVAVRMTGGAAIPLVEGSGGVVEEDFAFSCKGWP